eukprot:CAMPEP_0170183442 /NCGR_PEP_ID=MMETSP0040_2-20121228/30726_1 /TAXON_ID=641309 /ORGANISM="Lotharella oceanica, Strain CCMP622" /LENGTH=219 /DNA_ID=CAMNT_0010429177 /DNA_START=80 /DNA_END=739 /DNA_ORIENTATION=-
MKWGYACCRSLERDSRCGAIPNNDDLKDYMEHLHTTQVKRKKLGPSLPATIQPAPLSLVDTLQSRQDHFEKLRTRNTFSGREEFLIYTLKHLVLTWSLNPTAIPKFEQKYDFDEVAKGVEKLVMLIEKKQINPRILEGLENIFKNATAKDFTAANRLYFDLSIGKEPWPIGVGERNTYEQGKVRGAKFRRNLVLHDEEYRHLMLQVKRVLKFSECHYAA